MGYILTVIYELHHHHHLDYYYALGGKPSGTRRSLWPVARAKVEEAENNQMPPSLILTY